MRKAILALAVLGVLGFVGEAANCLPPKVPVTFTYSPLPNEVVTSVSLRGSFNNWGEWPMTPNPDGTWSLTVCLEPGVYPYKFFINGRWPRDMATARGGGPVDPEADYYVDDGFGGQNAVRVVKPIFTGVAPFHDPADPAFLCVADGRLVVRLWTAAGQAEEVALVTDRGTFPMVRQARWDWGEVWRASLPEVEPLRYRFQGRAVDGSTFAFPEDPEAFFTFQGEDRFPQLSWVSRGVGYQIFPDRFYNADPENDPLALETDISRYMDPEFWVRHWLWTGEVVGGPFLSQPTDPISPLHCCHQYFGGDLRGILAKLDYLAELGVTVLYLNPVFHSGSAHGYDTFDFYRVAPRLGTEEDLRELLQAAHARGMRVIFDFVPNHVGIGFWAFQDVVARGPESPYWDWFFIWKWPFRPGDPTAYESWWALGNLPKLNTLNPEVAEYLYEVALHWLRFGFAGIRVDVPNELLNAPAFFRELRARVKAEFPEAWLVAEIWQLEPAWVKGDQFDALMNYAVGRGVLLPYAQGRMDAERAFLELSRYLGSVGENVVAMNMNLVGSHDTGRVLTDLGGGRFGEEPAPEAIQRLKLLSTLLYALPGLPMTFQGDERGILGEKELFDAHRYPILWDRVNPEIYGHYQALGRLRKDLPALTTSAMRMYTALDGVLAFFRGHQDEVLVVANNARTPGRIALPPGFWRVVGTPRVVVRELLVPPLSALILERVGG